MDETSEEKKRKYTYPDFPLSGMHTYDRDISDLKAETSKSDKSRSSKSKVQYED
jgi:hypothetical protein